MEKIRSERGEVIITGLGGAGVLTTGTLLAEAAVERYKNVTWFPSYAISKRGGFTECSVVFSNDEIASPLLSQAEGVIVAEAAQFDDFEKRVCSGGTMVVERAGLQAKQTRDDITVVEVPAIETAINSSGTSKGANLILLGAFLNLTGMLPMELIEKQIEKAFSGKEKVLRSNLKSLTDGWDFIDNSKR